MALADDFDEPTIGHNRPPLVDELKEKYRDLTQRADELVNAVTRAPAEIADDVTQGKVGDLIKLITAAQKAAKTSHGSEKEPFLAGGRTVDAFFKTIIEGLDQHKAKLEARVTAYLRKKAEVERARREEEERAARAEAERLAQVATTTADLDRAIEQEAVAVEATKRAQEKPSDMARTRGDLGSVSTLRKSWEFEVIEYGDVPLDVLRPYLARADVEKAIRAFVRMGGRELKGVRIFEDQKAMVR